MGYPTLRHLHGKLSPRLTGLPYLADWTTHLGRSPCLSCKHDQDKIRNYMDRRVTPPRRVTSRSYVGMLKSWKKVEVVKKSWNREKKLRSRKKIEVVKKSWGRGKKVDEKYQMALTGLRSRPLSQTTVPPIRTQHTVRRTVFVYLYFRIFVFSYICIFVLLTWWTKGRASSLMLFPCLCFANSLW